MMAPARGPSMRPASGWLDDARQVPLLDVAAALGLAVARDGASFGPCPGCGEVVRGGDKRGRCVILDKTERWACYSRGGEGCGAKGDAVALVALVLTGKPWTTGDKATGDAIRAWYAGNGWCDPDNGADRAGQPRTMPRPRLVQQAAIAPKPRPPIAEVVALWARCVPVTADPAVAAWLANRNDPGPIDPEAVAGLDLVRALPANLDNLPRWAWYNGESWAASGHRLIVRAYEADADNPGLLRWASLHARNVRPDCAAGDKAAWPASCNASGLVLATGLDPAGCAWIELAEGVPDWLRLAVERAKSAKSIAIWGVWSGSETAELAARVPLGRTVAICTHADAAGDKYAERWAELLTPRGCTLRRRRMANGPASTIAPPDNSAERWAASAIAAMRDSAQGGELATIWAVAVNHCGGLDCVPMAVANVHRQRRAELNAAELVAYREQLAEFPDVIGGDNVGQ